jgi:EAL domain-containing protein (putative c-di-GMP-specific phosphodiesterase class I)/AmiR/NasT family two-component response regulator
MQKSEVPPFKAMILEDHEFQRKVAKQVLKVCGATAIVEAANGGDAIARLEEQTTAIDILVCDLNMPEMDGLEFLRHIGQRKSASSVILASGMDAAILRAAEMMARSYGVNILGIIEKPLSESKLLPLVLRHFGQSLLAPRAKLDLMPLDEIKAAIAARQFEPFFQPKVFMHNCKLAGVEALMRWRHPTRGLIQPGAFIPVMEANGLISDVTFMLIEAALQCSRRWRADGLETPIAVNLSVHSLADTTLPDKLIDLVTAVGLTSEALVIEVTETVAMTDLGHSLETLARLRMKGFGLSIDDYGTGFSSMQQLTRVPFSELKIDQVFVTGAGKQDILQALLGTSVTMAKQLKLKSVAEGVETNSDWETVARLGCDVAQGYFIGHPMPQDELIPWYRDWMGTRPAVQSAE